MARRNFPGAGGGRPEVRVGLGAILRRRARLLHDPATNVARLVHGRPDGIPGLVVERLGNVLIAQCHEGHLVLPEEAVRGLCQELMLRVEARGVYRKVYPRERSALQPALERAHHDPSPWLGEAAPAELEVLEHGLRFLVRPYDGYLTGLFLDHRTGRQRVRQVAAGRRVLNLFAYTCGYSVAAGGGGAAQVTSVDISRKSLEWGRANVCANELPADRHRFVTADAVDYCRRTAKRGECYDLIILDPPTFARGQHSRSVFQLGRDLPGLLQSALACLGPAGQLLLSCNHRGTPIERLQQWLRQAAQANGRAIQHLDRLPPPEDFQGDPDFAKSVLVLLDSSGGATRGGREM